MKKNFFKSKMFIFVLAVWIICSFIYCCCYTSDGLVGELLAFEILGISVLMGNRWGNDIFATDRVLKDMNTLTPVLQAKEFILEEYYKKAEENRKDASRFVSYGLFFIAIGFVFALLSGVLVVLGFDWVIHLNIHHVQYMDDMVKGTIISGLLLIGFGFFMRGFFFFKQHSKNFRESLYAFKVMLKNFMFLHIPMDRYRWKGLGFISIGLGFLGLSSIVYMFPNYY